MFEWTGTECHGILRYGKIYEYSLFVCLFGTECHGILRYGKIYEYSLFVVCLVPGSGLIGPLVFHGDFSPSLSSAVRPSGTPAMMGVSSSLLLTKITRWICLFMEDFPKFLFRTPYVLYGKRVVHFEKWTGGGKSTLLS